MIYKDSKKRKEVILIRNYEWVQFKEFEDEMINKVKSLEDIEEKEKNNFIKKIKNTDFEDLAKLLEQLLEKSEKLYEIVNEIGDDDDYYSSIIINEILGDKEDKKLYVFSNGDYGDNSIKGIFSNKEVAQKIANNCIGDLVGENYIDEYKLDEFKELYNEIPFKVVMGYKGWLFSCINNKKYSTGLFKDIRENIRKDKRMVKFELYASTEKEAVSKCRNRINELNKNGELYEEK